MGTVQRHIKSGYLGCFWHWCLCIPNRHKPISNCNEILLSRYEETMARLQKIRDAGYNVSIWGREFRKLLWAIPDLEKELSLHPYVKNSPIYIRAALYGGRTEATKTCYRVKQGEEISNVDVISFYPYICKEGKFSCVTRKCTWVQNAPRTVWIWKA